MIETVQGQDQTMAVTQTQEVLQEAVEVEDLKFEKFVKVAGNAEQYTWDQVGADYEVKIKFCTFNTRVGEEVFSTTVGIDENNIPVAAIAYNTDITIEIVNYIVNHVMMVTCQQAISNDTLLYTIQSKEGEADIETYCPLGPVLQAIGALHSWANIAQFQTQTEEETQAEVAEVEEVVVE